jgi:hypothetical protein
VNTLSLTVEPLPTLTQRAEQLLALKTDLEAALEQAKSDLKELVVENGGDPIIVGDKRVSLDIMPGRQTLDKQKLVEQGVTTDIILAATKRGDDYTQLSVRKSSKADLAKAGA